MDNEIEYDQNVVRIYANVLRLIKVIKSFWKTLVLLIILANAIGYWIHSKKEEVYKSGSSIIIEEKGSNGGLGSLATMAAQMGMSSGMAPDETKVIQLLKTKAVVFPALLTKVEINGVNDYLVNHFIKIQLKNNNRRLVGNKNMSNLTIDDHHVLLYAHSSFINPKAETYRIEPSKEGGLISMNVLTYDRSLSYELNKNLLSSIEEFYSGNMRKKEEASIFIMEDKLSIISASMDSMENIYAQWKERNFQSLTAAALVQEMRFRRSLELYNGMFLETYKTLELKRVNAEFENQYIRVVNFPNLPINSKRYDLIIFLIVSTIAAIIGGMIIVVAYNAIKDLNTKVKSLE